MVLVVWPLFVWPVVVAALWLRGGGFWRSALKASLWVALVWVAIVAVFSLADALGIGG